MTSKKAHCNTNEKPIVFYLPYLNTCLGPKTKSRGHTFLMDLRHISIQRRKRFLFAIPIYVTRTDEINQNSSRNALAIEQSPCLKTRMTGRFTKIGSIVLLNDVNL